MKKRLALVGNGLGALCISLALQSFPERFPLVVLVPEFCPHSKKPQEVLFQGGVNGTEKNFVFSLC